MKTLKTLSLGESLIIASAGLDKALQDIVAEARPKMVKSTQDDLMAVTERTLNLIKEHKITNRAGWNNSHPMDKLFMNYLESSSIPGSAQIDPDHVKLKSNAQDLMKKDVEKIAGQILDNFVSKVKSKLAKITTQAGDPTVKVLSIRHSGSNVEVDLQFNFENKSSFRARTQIVFVWNQNNTQFSRFPLTFHDVILKDGTRMKSPSEKKMLEEFI